jgi:hypothetical protein
MTDRISVREIMDRVYNSDMAIKELAKVGIPLATLDALANGTHRVVPVEPTEAMLTAGVEAGGDWPETTADAYRAMISAAEEPKP